MLVAHNHHHMQHSAHSEMIFFPSFLQPRSENYLLVLHCTLAILTILQHSFIVNKYLQFGYYVQGKQATIDIHNCVGGVCQYILLLPFPYKFTVFLAYFFV